MEPHAAACSKQLEQLKKDFEEFAYIVSHDMKAPVRAIVNLSQWIEEDLGDHLPPDVKHNMDLLRNRAFRLERMIEALLQYSRVSRYDLETGPTDLLELLLALKAELPPHVQVDVPAELPVLLTYKAKLRQVLSQLLQNASFFTQKDRPKIIVRVQEQAEFLLFEVTDNGDGIPAEALSKVFTLFYTVCPKDKVDTVGAGLAISKKTVQFAGGTIEALANEPEGTTIRFTWPKGPLTNT
ncbi:histidine kinase/DNA gyrase B/HSP90-like ATPase [Pontibacter ummariensis]|uniref:histidine kinase n=2 Tax=Pontibacter ummariensis TaxID=1610492 RepID=A0A239DHX8_9BACT|nr:HAMP domain-containing sensor histidine kinase [Pontibacter ummariensis]PRY14433.1 histidine kinase/DNA gyrase B/HSP90-like ATPase [Pontibacter ummariensis]SNS31879.1 Histidine kinase-, DNA gyrase B-, and HSP90-like ATPase [Pontibacter ummariensis]